MRKVAIVVFAFVNAVALATTATAQEVQYDVTVRGELVKGSPNDHFVTFSAPVQIPEVTLPAGTYVFSVIAPSIVQVTSADRSQQYAMFFTAPVQRMETTDDYTMKIVPSGAAAPGRIAEWYLPNQTRGFEFLYPRAETLGER